MKVRTRDHYAVSKLLTQSQPVQTLTWWSPTGFWVGIDPKASSVVYSVILRAAILDAHSPSSKSNNSRLHLEPLLQPQHSYIYHYQNFCTLGRPLYPLVGRLILLDTIGPWTCDSELAMTDDRWSVQRACRWWDVQLCNCAEFGRLDQRYVLSRSGL